MLIDRVFKYVCALGFAFIGVSLFLSTGGLAMVGKNQERGIANPINSTSLDGHSIIFNNATIEKDDYKNKNQKGFTVKNEIYFTEEEKQLFGKDLNNDIVPTFKNASEGEDILNEEVILNLENIVKMSESKDIMNEENEYPKILEDTTIGNPKIRIKRDKRNDRTTTAPRTTGLKLETITNFDIGILGEYEVIFNEDDFNVLTANETALRFSLERNKLPVLLDDSNKNAYQIWYCCYERIRANKDFVYYLDSDFRLEEFVKNMGFVDFVFDYNNAESINITVQACPLINKYKRCFEKYKKEVFSKYRRIDLYVQPTRKPKAITTIETPTTEISTIVDQNATICESMKILNKDTKYFYDNCLEKPFFKAHYLVSTAEKFYDDHNHDSTDRNLMNFIICMKLHFIKARIDCCNWSVQDEKNAMRKRKFTYEDSEVVFLIASLGTCKNAHNYFESFENYTENSMEYYNIFIKEYSP